MYIKWSFYWELSILFIYIGIVYSANMSIENSFAALSIIVFLNVRYIGDENILHLWPLLPHQVMQQEVIIHKNCLLLEKYYAIRLFKYLIQSTFLCLAHSAIIEKRERIRNQFILYIIYYYMLYNTFAKRILRNI